MRCKDSLKLSNRKGKSCLTHIKVMLNSYRSHIQLISKSYSTHIGMLNDLSPQEVGLK